jgi:hypothetical protein
MSLFGDGGKGQVSGNEDKKIPAEAGMDIF